MLVSKVSFLDRVDCISKVRDVSALYIIPTVAGLGELVEHLTAERKVVGLIPGARPVLKVLK